MNVQIKPESVGRRAQVQTPNPLSTSVHARVTTLTEGVFELHTEHCLMDVSCYSETVGMTL